jgi:two-component system, NarL family, nitrate/nitrite response regulator NarL
MYNQKICVTEREFQVLSKLLQGYTTAEIAQSLFVSRETINTHRKNLLIKLNAKNACHLAVRAFEHNLVA